MPVRVLVAMSGGVDSSVAAALVHKAIGDQLTCIFVDTGLLRLNEREQVERVASLRRERSAEAVTRALDALKRGASTPDENLMPLISTAVKAEATLGEISDTLRGVFGEHREHVVL